MVGMPARLGVLSWTWARLSLYRAHLVHLHYFNVTIIRTPHDTLDLDLNLDLIFTRMFLCECMFCHRSFIATGFLSA